MRLTATRDNVQKLARDAKAENERFFKRLKKKTPGNLDEIVHQLHNEAFETFDCLTCRELLQQHQSDDHRQGCGTIGKTPPFKTIAGD